MMPFRIPHGYESLTTCQGDPDQRQTELYLTWLHQEVKTAEAYYAANWGQPKVPEGRANEVVTSSSSWLVRRAVRLWNAGKPFDERVNTFAELAKVSPQEFRQTRNVGRTAVEAIQIELADRGIRWAL